MCKATKTMTKIDQLAAQIMQRCDVYEAAGRGVGLWGDYLADRLCEAGLCAEKHAALELSRALAAIWVPEVPHWSLDAVLKGTKASDGKAFKAVARLLEQAQASGQLVTYEQDGNRWTVTGVKASERTGTPMARVLPSGRWFCFASAEGFSLG